ncbi:MAG: IS66 family insertion sequence element accessory protein TnpB [Patescibacteria group bacterium]|nr:IS66 family insertion sequence element accessory protein TnpB [Patescibacteria group bacterium]
MKPVSKEEFLAILERQQKSGLSIKDFCANESYTVSSFHYWKTKFGLTRSYNNHAPEAPTSTLAPISINLPVKAPVSSPASSPRSSQGEIRIKLPGGIQVSFIGTAQAELAINLLNQICSRHVLPE